MRNAQQPITIAGDPDQDVSPYRKFLQIYRLGRFPAKDRICLASGSFASMR
jgi:hypothetical protein